jgi:hypothetical protein
VSTRPPVAADARSLARWVIPASLGGLALVVFFLMQPLLIFQDNTPTGGDMGAHVLLPAYLRDELLPQWRILGWSNSWYAGFPAMYFYFPLPAIVIVVLGLVMPYGIAFKLVTVLGLVALPFASYVLARGMGMSRAVSTVAGVSGGTFVLMESFTIYGGNTLSTLAGEYSFSWSFALSMAYLGLIIRNVREGRGFTLGPAIFIALAALSHLITTVVVVVASLPLLLRRRGPSTLATTWGLGFAVAAFWALPFLVRSNMMTHMGWHPVRGFGPVFPSEMWPMIVLAVGGIAWAAHKRLVISPLITMMLVGAGGYFFIQFIDFRNLYNARLLGFWYYGVYLLAGVCVGALLVGVARRLRRVETAKWTLAAVGAVVMLIVGVIGVHRAPSWARWNYSGYESKKSYGTDADGNSVVVTDYWAEYQDLMAAIDRLPPGRVMWEVNSGLNQYGTSMSLMIIDYWLDDHVSMEGVLFESSLTTPFHFLNASEVSYRPSNPVGGLDYHPMDFERAVPHLAMYDIAYYISFTEEATAAAMEATEMHGFAVLDQVGPFTIFDVPESSLVDIAVNRPSVWAGSGSIHDAALEWYGDVDGLDRWLVEDGPADWARVDSVDDLRSVPISASGEVTDIVLENHRVSFRTTAIGVPHMVKVSYFPNWGAEGALGPYRAAPSLMIVIPTEEEVVLEFRDTWAELAGRFLTIGSVLGIVAWKVVRKRRERAEVEA